MKSTNSLRRLGAHCLAISLPLVFAGTLSAEERKGPPHGKREHHDHGRIQDRHGHHGKRDQGRPDFARAGRLDHHGKPPHARPDVAPGRPSGRFGAPPSSFPRPFSPQGGPRFGKPGAPPQGKPGGPDCKSGKPPQSKPGCKGGKPPHAKPDCQGGPRPPSGPPRFGKGGHGKPPHARPSGGKGGFRIRFDDPGSNNARPHAKPGCQSGPRPPFGSPRFGKGGHGKPPHARPGGGKGGFRPRLDGPKRQGPPPFIRSMLRKGGRPGGPECCPHRSKRRR